MAVPRRRNPFHKHMCPHPSESSLREGPVFFSMTSSTHMVWPRLHSWPLTLPFSSSFTDPHPQWPVYSLDTDSHVFTHCKLLFLVSPGLSTLPQTPSPDDASLFSLRSWSKCHLPNFHFWKWFFPQEQRARLVQPELHLLGGIREPPKQRGITVLRKKGGPGVSLASGTTCP